MFWDWQGTLTQSSVTVGNNPMQRMDVWFCVTRRNRAERLNREAMNRLMEQIRRSPERDRRSSLNLIKTYHGSRLIVHMTGKARR